MIYCVDLYKTLILAFLFQLQLDDQKKKISTTTALKL